MQNELKNLRFSDTDLSAYLITLGYEVSQIEVVKDKRNNKLKAFVHFLGNKDELINLQNKFNNNQVMVVPKEFSKAKKKLNKLIKAEIIKYEIANL